MITVLVSLGLGLLCVSLLSSLLSLSNSWHAPDSNIVKTQVRQMTDGSCYRMMPVPYACPFRGQKK